jgi:hypothetical protein
MTKLKLARLRQEVRFLKGRRAALERIAMAPVPMVAASLIQRQFRLGGPTYHYLVIPTPENVAWHGYVRKDDVDYYRRRAANWSEFTNAMAEWVRVNREIERRLRMLGKGRCEKLEIRRRRKPPTKA